MLDELVAERGAMLPVGDATNLLDLGRPAEMHLQFNSQYYK
jgi:hypothetical protein